VLVLSPLKEEILVGNRWAIPISEKRLRSVNIAGTHKDGGIFAVSSTTPKPTGKEEGDARAKAFEQAYKETHPNGPYLRVELKPRPKEGPE